MSTHTAAEDARLEEDGAAHADALVGLRSISVRFGGIVAVDDVNLELRRGEICGLIGPNGAGKSTLFDVISGVRAPTTGTVHLDGRDVSRTSAISRSRAGVRRTFQQVQAFGWLSVSENVLVGLEWRGGGGGVLADLVAAPSRRRHQRERQDRVDEVLHECGLWELRHVSASALPTGHARMLELARAIVDPPRLLMLDEPASGLDHAEAERLAERIHAVRAMHGSAVLLVEHSVPFVMKHCDRVVVLELGRLLAEGSPAEIGSNEAVKVAYLGAST